MSFPMNSFTGFLALTNVLQQQSLLETRIENNVSGQPIYIAYSITPNADTAARVWYILKMSYDGGGFLSRVQKPDNGDGFLYIYDDRATYFS